jgi:hypothetical protein
MTKRNSLVRSPYFLKTDKGYIEITKGMYLCLIRKKKDLSFLTTKKLTKINYSYT